MEKFYVTRTTNGKVFCGKQNQGKSFPGQGKLMEKLSQARKTYGKVVWGKGN